MTIAVTIGETFIHSSLCSLSMFVINCMLSLLRSSLVRFVSLDNQFQ